MPNLSLFLPSLLVLGYPPPHRYTPPPPQPPLKALSPIHRRSSSPSPPLVSLDVLVFPVCVIKSYKGCTLMIINLCLSVFTLYSSHTHQLYFSGWPSSSEKRTSTGHMLHHVLDALPISKYISEYQFVKCLMACVVLLFPIQRVYNRQKSVLPLIEHEYVSVSRSMHTLSTAYDFWRYYNNPGFLNWSQLY